MRLLFLRLCVCFLLVLYIDGQDPCEDLKKEFEELQRRIDENIQKIDKLIEELENQDENPAPPPDTGGNGTDEKSSTNPVNGSLTDEEWANLTNRIQQELAKAVENVKKWLGPGGIAFWDCIDPEARLVLTELMLYVGPREFKKQFDKMKGSNYKRAAEIIRNSRWGKQNRKRAEALAKRMENIQGPVKAPDKRSEDGLEECWPEASQIRRPTWLERLKGYFKSLRRP